MLMTSFNLSVAVLLTRLALCEVFYYKAQGETLLNQFPISGDIRSGSFLTLPVSVTGVTAPGLAVVEAVPVVEWRGGLGVDRERGDASRGRWVRRSGPLRKRQPGDGQKREKED